jgi:hypothetical protein
LILGAVLVGVPAGICIFQMCKEGAKGCQVGPLCGVLITVIVALLLLRVFATSALAAMVGEKALTSAGKKTNNGVKNIIAGTTVLGLSCAIPFAGWTAIVIISLMTVGASVAALKK